MEAILAPEMALNPEPTTDWNWVVSYLHWSGLNKTVLTPAQRREVRLLADGYGKGVTDPNLVFDWSHVRDSSEEAVKAMADRIKHFVL